MSGSGLWPPHLLLAHHVLGLLHGWMSRSISTFHRGWHLPWLRSSVCLLNTQTSFLNLHSRPVRAQPVSLIRTEISVLFHESRAKSPGVRDDRVPPPLQPPRGPCSPEAAPGRGSGTWRSHRRGSPRVWRSPATTGNLRPRGCAHEQGPHTPTPAPLSPGEGVAAGFRSGEALAPFLFESWGHTGLVSTDRWTHLPSPS